MTGIIVRLDVMMAMRKIKGRDLAARIGITEQNLSLLKSGKVKGIRFETLAKLCEALECQPGDLLEAAATDAPLTTLTSSARTGSLNRSAHV
ncbi:helix-turn-helix transcriptional regulator [uncultured Tateyamaria sp.]|uniref:helix-turn-helix domain-containing protein n=1 Tax=uncultured Tateyamaria sp. TaxID=455651 RepID=UPI00262FF6FB|nr:helix-turn-helix transcriptional regulator [uncultured Tateyamaria sp.]